MQNRTGPIATLAIAALFCCATTLAAPRARDLGVPFEGEPGPLNAITDVAGLLVGHSTIIEDAGKPVRTGVTAILPRGRQSPTDAVFAGWFSLNGNGEMTGTTWVDESGLMYGPVMITNTHSVGVVRDSVIAWALEHYRFDTSDWWSLPVVAETWDGWLNDINGFHVKREHAFAALDGAAGGPVAEGNVGGGTGMICFEFKCGIGTASRRVRDGDTDYTVGVLVQANFGRRSQLLVAGMPVGYEVPEEPAYAALAPRRGDGDMGSIIVVVATDAPLLPHQLERIAKRAGLGIARTGGVASDSSGDIFIAFSTANPRAADVEGLPVLKMLPNARITPFFAATAYATEEAIVNALVAARTLEGFDGHRAIALPHERLRAVLKRHDRLAAPAAAASH